MAQQKADQENRVDPYATPREAFSIVRLKNGYSAEESYKLHDGWDMTKFVDITQSGAYSYLHLPEFMPHSVIRRDGPVSVLSTRINPSVGSTSLKDAGGTLLSLDQMITAEDSPVQGVMVLHRGEIAYEQYPGMRKSDNHVWMSNAKILAGLLIAQLEEEGKLNVQNTVAEYVKEAKGTAWENVRVLDVLNMQSGLDLEENPASRKGDTPYERFVAAEVGQPNRRGVVETHNEALLAIPRLHDAGQSFEYSSANTQMLGLIIERVADQRLSELLSDRVWQHSGMVGDAVCGLSPQGNGIIHGLVSSRLGDMARTGLLFTPSWNKTASKHIVSDAIVKKIQTAGTKGNYLKGALGPHLVEELRDTPMFNSYQWDAVFADGDIYKSGMNGQGIYVSPTKDLVIVWFATGRAKIPMEAFARKIAAATYSQNSSGRSAAIDRTQAMNRKPATRAEAKARVSRWVARLGNKGVQINTNLKGHGFVAQRVPGLNAYMYVLEQEGWFVTLGMTGKIEPGDTVDKIRGRFEYVSLDRVAIDEMTIPGWEIRPLTRQSSFRNGVEFVSLKDGRLTVRVQASFFSIHGRDTRIQVPADAAAPPNSYFRVTKDIPCTLTIAAPLGRELQN